MRASTFALGPHFGPQPHAMSKTFNNKKIRKEFIITLPLSKRLTSWFL